MRALVLAVVLAACSSSEREQPAAAPAPTAPAPATAAQTAPADAAVPDAAPPDAMPADRFVGFELESNEEVVVRHHRHQVDACLVAAGSALPRRGEITIELGKDGPTVVSKSNKHLTGVQSCLRQAAASWSLPPRERSATPAFTVRWQREQTTAELRAELEHEIAKQIDLLSVDDSVGTATIATLDSNDQSLELGDQIDSIRSDKDDRRATRGRATGVGPGRKSPPTDAPTGRIALDTVSSDLPEYDATARRILTARLGALKQCYRIGLKKDPALEGRLELRFSIEANGRVSASQARGFDAAVASCARGKVRGWRFPAPPADEAPLEVQARFVCKPL